MSPTADSALRFFPLQEHAELGLTLHAFDLATNKVLALVGRLEVLCVLDIDSDLLRVGPGELTAALASGRVRFHRGTIRGAMPRLVDRWTQ